MDNVEIHIKSTYDDSGVKRAMSDMAAYRAKIKSLSDEALSSTIDDAVASVTASDRDAMRGKFFNKVYDQLFAKNMDSVPYIGDGMKSSTATGLTWRDTTSKFLTSLEGIKMPLLFFGLSVMFAGMAVQRMVQGLIQPAAEMTGIFEIFGIILALLFLPAMLALLPYLVKFLDLVVEFTEKHPYLTKMFGLIVIGIGVLASFFTIIGQGITLIAGILSLLGIQGVIGGISTGAGAAGVIGGGASLGIGAWIRGLFGKPTFAPEAKMGGQSFTKGTANPFAMPDMGKWGGRFSGAALMFLAMMEPIGGKNKFDWLNPSTWGEIFTPPTTAYVGDNWMRMNTNTSSQNINVTNNFNISSSPNTMGGYAMDNNSLAPV